MLLWSMKNKRKLDFIPNEELLRSLDELVKKSRHIESDLVAHIGEIDDRELYVGKGSASMFSYSTAVLHLPEAVTYLRIRVARASRKHPMLLEMLGDGRLSLSAIARLAPHLTEANRETILKRAVHKSKRQIQELIAEIFPKPGVPGKVRKLPGRREMKKPSPVTSTQLRPDAVTLPAVPGPAPPAQQHPDAVVMPSLPKPVKAVVIEPLSPRSYKTELTIDGELFAPL